MKINIKNGTPQNPKSICTRCSESLIMQGAAVSQHVVYCKAMSYDNPMIVPFEVIECNRFNELGKPQLWDMQKIAWIITSDGKKGGKLGFIPAKQFKEKEKIDRDEDICPTPDWDKL